MGGRCAERCDASRRDRKQIDWLAGARDDGEGLMKGFCHLRIGKSHIGIIRFKPVSSPLVRRGERARHSRDAHVTTPSLVPTTNAPDPEASMAQTTRGD